MRYLGFIITPQGLEMDPTKVNAVRQWPAPRNVKDLQTFLGFANFYRRFIAGYSRVCRPLTELTSKNTPWDWETTPRRQDAFRQLCDLFTSAPILRHFDFDQPIVVETDSSDYVSAGVLSQHDEQGILHPVAFFSKKLPLLSVIMKFMIKNYRPSCAPSRSGAPTSILQKQKFKF